MIVTLHGFRRELALIVLGQTHNPHLTLALVVWLSGLTTTACSRRRPRFVQRATQSITDPLRTLLYRVGGPGLVTSSWSGRTVIEVWQQPMGCTLLRVRA
jgi:hypothetical protein